MSVSTLGDTPQVRPDDPYRSYSPKRDYSGQDYTKACTHCGEIKTCSSNPARSQFYFNRKHQKFHSWCKLCMNSTTREAQKRRAQERAGTIPVVERPDSHFTHPSPGKMDLQCPHQVHLRLDEIYVKDLLRLLEVHQAHVTRTHDFNQLYTLLTQGLRELSNRQRDIELDIAGGD